MHLRRYLLLPALLAGGGLWAGAQEKIPLVPLRPAMVRTKPAGIDRLIRVGIEDNGTPFSFRNPAGEPDGFSVEMLREIARTQGLRLDITVRSWPEILAGYNRGEYDLLGNVAYSSEREGLMEFSTTKLVMSGGLFQLVDRPPIRRTADLKGLRIAALRDSLGHIYASRQRWDATIVPVESRREAIQMLREGRCDAVLMMALVMNYFLRLEGTKDVVQSELSLDDLNYRLHYGVKPGDRLLLRAINEGLLAAQRNGTYDRIYQKWLGPLQPRQLEWRDLRPYALPALLLLVAVVSVIATQREMLRRSRKHAAAVRESEERLKLVLEGGRHGFWDWDIPAGIVRRNDYAATMLGYRPEEIGPAHSDWVDLVHPHDREQVAAAGLGLARDGHGPRRLEYRIRARDGSWRWLETTGKVTTRDDTGRPLRATGTHTDITDRIEAEEANRRLQEKMLETQRLEGLGVLAGGIAHDFNNLLTVIMGNVALSQTEAGETPETRARLTKALTAANRAADLCRQLLAYAGQGSFTITRINLNDLVRETASLIEGSVRERAQLRLNLGESLPPIEGDFSQVQQIVMNLVLNAAEAMPSTGGKIEITTTAEALAAGALPDALPAPPARGGVYLRLQVTDTGSGMTPEVRARIFDPFFTTKFTGRGLGLAAVLGIVRSHRGALTVASQPGAGSTFCVYLPIAEMGRSHSNEPPAV